MKKIGRIGLILLITTSVYASDIKNGFFMGIGGTGGMEVWELKRIGGGLALASGYKFNKNLAALLLTDFFYTKKQGVHYLFIPVEAQGRFFFHEGAYAYAGGGYQFLRATDGPHFGVNSFTSTYSGLTGEAGGGYEFCVEESISVTTQLGLQYIRIAGANLYTPNFRLYFGYHF